jgi:hypothetical protein
MAGGIFRESLEMPYPSRGYCGSGVAEWRVGNTCFGLAPLCARGMGSSPVRFDWWRRQGGGHVGLLSHL